MKAILRACETFLVCQRLKRLQNETAQTTTNTTTARTYANTDRVTVTNRKSSLSATSSSSTSSSLVWWSNQIIFIVYVLLLYSFTVTTAANTFRPNITSNNSINSDYKAKQQHIPSAVTFHHNQIHQPLDNSSAFNTHLNNATRAALTSTSATLAVKEILDRRRKKNEVVSRNEHIFTTTTATPLPPSHATKSTTTTTTTITTTVWLSGNVNAAVSTSTLSTSLLFQDSITESSSAESSTVLNDTSAGYENSEIPEIPSYIRTTAMFFCIIIMLMGVIGNVMVSYVSFSSFSFYLYIQFVKKKCIDF